MYYYLVAPTTIIRKDQTAFTYHSDKVLEVGMPVRVSVGKRLVSGVIISAVTTQPSFKTKSIDHVYSTHALPLPLIRLAQWIADYYATHLATVLGLLLPIGIHKVRRASADETHAVERKRTKIVLNNEQAAAISYLENKKNGTFLLHGVTGSGKTQVYIELAKQQQYRGKSVIILVPEIALTPQLVAEFKNHFNDILVTHSSLSEAQRHHIWLKALESDKPLVVIGPRSALFIPVKNVGLIVVDECHEPGYKQDQAPRYSALRVATMLARFHHEAKAVFGTATPNVGDYYLANANTTSIVTLSSTARKAKKPTITIVDNRRRDYFRRHTFISDALLALMTKALGTHNQTILFHNRRGTAPMVLCTHCGWAALCERCYVPLTLHADRHSLLCHLCGTTRRILPSCPECRHPDIVFRGLGTKLIEEEVRKIFPTARIARFDADNAVHETLQSRYQQLYDNEIDVIIGTQLLAKGLDLPKLTTVGVIQADSGLYLPDYQAEERTFQLLYQIVGRVGRTDQESNVVVQTYTPDHPVIAHSLYADYKSFYKAELARRHSLVFPPFTYLLKLTCSYKTEKGAIQAAKQLKVRIEQQQPKLTIIGPAPAFYERRADKYRWQLLIKSQRRADLITIAKEIPQGWQADIDPASLL